MPIPDIRVTTRPHTNKARLFTEIPSKGENARNPDSNENSLTLVPR